MSQSTKPAEEGPLPGTVVERLRRRWLPSADDHARNEFPMDQDELVRQLAVADDERAADLLEEAEQIPPHRRRPR